MSKLLEFILGSILITVFTVAFIFFSALQYILRAGNISDCAWYGYARTWIDSNRDGEVDPGEPPLSDVEIHIDDVQNQLFDISWPVITDNDGDVPFHVTIPGCSNTVFAISVDIPEGYRITTRPRIQVHLNILEGSGTERVYYFGFVADR